MLPRAEWGAFDNQAPIEPLDLDANVARWSGVHTAAEMPLGTEPESA